MRLVMTLLVRDEEDIIEANLRYHFAQGVDFVVVTDNGSVDGTVDILSRYERAGRVHLIHEPTDDYSQGRWVTRMARMACTEFGADWVINADADEFWWPASGTLAATLAAVPARFGVVTAVRHNFVCRPPRKGPFFERMVIRQSGAVNHPGYECLPMGPKACHRAHPTVTVAQGNHVLRDHPGEVLVDGRLRVFHYPVRSFRQFENKIVKGGQAYERNQEFGADVGGHWRALLAVQRQGRLPATFARFVLDDQSVEAGLADGSLVVDTRVRDYLATLEADAHW